MSLTRRRFLASTGAVSAAVAAPLFAWRQQLDRPAGDPARIASDEHYWQRVAGHYRVTDKVINLEAGYWGMMATPVADDYLRHIDRVNRESSYYARRVYNADLAAVRKRIAGFLRVDPDEIAFARSATESLYTLIGGYNLLKPGEAVLYADLDYPAMQNAMNALAERRGAKVIRITVPEPASHGNVIAAYSEALAKNPRIRLVLLTHVSNKTGLVMPVAELTALARSRGADTIVDAAHAIGQMDVRIPDIGADFVGFNLHKWIGAPLGVAVFYIRKARLSAIDRMMGEEGESINSRIHTGTTNFAAFLTIPAALDFHEAVGPAEKAARLRYLRDRWVRAVRELPQVQVLTPDDPRMSAGITSFRLRGRSSGPENDRLVETLLAKHGIFTRRSPGIDGGDCIRVTPALYTRPEDVDRLADAVKQLAASA
jgi:selenocysteine lyase/cysteine desulfurase